MNAWWHGKRVATYAFHNGKRHGVGIEWDELSGAKIGEFSYDRGLLSGKVERWHENGMKLLDGHYRDEKATGQWTFWLEDGTKYLVVLFSSGRRISPNGEPIARFYAAGRLSDWDQHALDRFIWQATSVSR